MFPELGPRGCSFALIFDELSVGRSNLGGNGAGLVIGIGHGPLLDKGRFTFLLNAKADTMANRHGIVDLLRGEGSRGSSVLGVEFGIGFVDRGRRRGLGRYGLGRARFLGRSAADAQQENAGGTENRGPHRRAC